MPPGAVILYGCLMGYGGQVIASRSVGRSFGEDGDRLSNALEGILTFVDEAYPASSREPFEALDHGPVRILMERGRFSMLILVIQGREDSGLREGMREILERFEERNEAPLGQGDYGPQLRQDGHDSLTTASHLTNVF